MPTTETAFTALYIEGGLLPPEFLARMAALDVTGQSPSDYGIPPGRTIRDEIGRYWSIAEALWKEYREQRQRTDVLAIRVGVERWLARLFRDVLGYSDLVACSTRAQIGERSFPVTHTAHNGSLPFLLTTADHDLDRPHRVFGDENRRRSPHATVQEYLNAEPTALWGVLSNGLRLRLIRDNPALTRPAFVEADLERIFEEGLYPDFTAFWLLIHASRSAPDSQGVAGQRLEAWRAEGAKVGQRALENLRNGVTTALRELGSGFVEHPSNEPLRAALRDGSFTPDSLHQQLLRFVYRLLFLFAAEERGLLHPLEAGQDAKDLYLEGYSLARLRERSRFKRHYDQHADLWAGLTITFRALAWGTPPLGLPALGGLFNPEECADLDRASISNVRLLAAIHALAFFTTEGALQRVNYRDMDTEELGSVYESLLELQPVVQVATRPWTFGFVGDESGGSAKGNERKLSGSYYTPDSLVQELLRSALDPVIERTIRDNPQDPREALLRLKVLDPACGSGHFLLGAARRLADAVARLAAEDGVPEEAQRRHALREVVRRCIFGVDRNPLSVELCKTALWIETIEPGKPLSFLDAHIKCGDSLIGLFDLQVLQDGIPDEAYNELTADQKAVCRDLKKRNRNANRGMKAVQTNLFHEGIAKVEAESRIELEAMPEDTLEQVKAKARAFESLGAHPDHRREKLMADLYVAAFFIAKNQESLEQVPLTEDLHRVEKSLPDRPFVAGAATTISSETRFFHWPLEFREVINKGGFDVVLGNPPWEVSQFREDEFFDQHDPSIARLSSPLTKCLFSRNDGPSAYSRRSELGWRYGRREP